MVTTIIMRVQERPSEHAGGAQVSTLLVVYQGRLSGGEDIYKGS